MTVTDGAIGKYTMSGKVLLGDLSSGVYLKLALAEQGHRPDGVSLYACESLRDFEEAVAGYVNDNGDPHLLGAAFSTSGWDVDGHIDLVHYGFSLDRQQLCGFLGTPRVSLVNDFVAKALAVPVLTDDERVQVCGGAGQAGQVVAVVGPTMGLGGAVLSPNGRGGWVANHCEGGHADFAARNLLEIEILKLMMDKYGHARAC